MRNKKFLAPIVWLVLACFLVSIDGVRVCAFEILDSPGTQDTLPTTVEHTEETSDAPPASTGTESSGDGDADARDPLADQVAPEPLNTPSNQDECILVDHYEWYNIPAGELEAGEGRSGPCGPYATTSALKGRGKKITYAEVLKVLKPQDCFTVPGEIVDYLIDMGVSCRRVDNSSVEQILNIIKEDRRSVLCLVHASDVEKTENGYVTTEADVQHWVNIVGMRLADGQPISMLMKDAAWSYWGGRVKEMPVEEFDYRWKAMDKFAFAINTKRMLLKVGGIDSATFEDRMAAYLQYMYAGEVAAGGIATGYKALGAMWSGLQEFLKTGNPTTFINGAHQLVASVGKIVAGLTGLAVYYVGTGLDIAGKFLCDSAQKMWDNGGIIGKLASIPTAVFGAALQLVGGIIQAVGNIFASVTECIGNIISNVADAIARFFDSLFDALNPKNWF